MENAATTEADCAPARLERGTFLQWRQSADERARNWRRAGWGATERRAALPAMLLL